MFASRACLRSIRSRQQGWRLRRHPRPKPVCWDLIFSILPVCFLRWRYSVPVRWRHRWRKYLREFYPRKSHPDSNCMAWEIRGRTGRASHRTPGRLVRPWSLSFLFFFYISRFLCCPKHLRIKCSCRLRQPKACKTFPFGWFGIHPRCLGLVWTRQIRSPPFSFF